MGSGRGSLGRTFWDKVTPESQFFSQSCQIGTAMPDPLSHCGRGRGRLTSHPAWLTLSSFYSPLRCHLLQGACLAALRTRSPGWSLLPQAPMVPSDCRSWSLSWLPPLPTTSSSLPIDLPCLVQSRCCGTAGQLVG